jgi:transcription initiation factor TFIID subunit 5
MVRHYLFVVKFSTYHMAKVTTSNTSSVSSRTWEENTGLIGSLIPVASNVAAAKTVNGKLSTYDPNAFNAQQGDLKLGPAPLSDSLREETERVLKEDPDESAHVVDNSAHTNGNGDVKERERDGKDEEVKPFGEMPSATSGGLIAPTTADLLPQPPTFRSVDVKREVEKVRDARKRIKLDPSMLFADSGRETNGFVHPGVSALSSRFPASALPSICAYTFHDALDG